MVFNIKTSAECEDRNDGKTVSNCISAISQIMNLPTPKSFVIKQFSRLPELNVCGSVLSLRNILKCFTLLLLTEFGCSTICDICYGIRYRYNMRPYFPVTKQENDLQIVCVSLSTLGCIMAVNLIECRTNMLINYLIVYAINRCLLTSQVFLLSSNLS